MLDCSSIAAVTATTFEPSPHIIDVSVYADTTSFTMLASDVLTTSADCMAKGFDPIDVCSVVSIGLTPSCVSISVEGAPLTIDVTNCPANSQFKLVCQDTSGATVESEPIDLTGLNCHSIG